MMYPSGNKMVKLIWNESVMIRKVYENSVISRFKYQSLKSQRKNGPVWIGQ